MDTAYPSSDAETADRARAEPSSSPVIELAAESSARSESPDVAELRQGIIPESQRRNLKIIPEAQPAAVAVQERISRLITEYLPGLDQQKHPVRILLGDNPDVPGARLKYTPITTIVIGKQQILSASSDAELMLTVLHELTHALLAKGYLPHELFDLMGIDKFRVRDEREANVPDEHKPSAGKFEEGGAHTLPLFWLADAGKDPRVYGTYFEKLFQAQREARKTGTFGLAQEILDEHPLPEVTEGLAEAASVVYLNARGSLPTGKGGDISDLQAAVRSARYLTQIEVVAERAGVDVSSIAQRITCARDFVAARATLSRADISELTEFISSRSGVALDPPTDLSAAHELAERLRLAGAVTAYEMLTNLVAPEVSSKVILGPSLVALTEKVKALEGALREDTAKSTGKPLPERLEGIAPLVGEVARLARVLWQVKGGDSFVYLARKHAAPFADYDGKVGTTVPWQLLFQGLCSDRSDFLAFRVAAKACGFDSDARFAGESSGKKYLEVSAEGQVGRGSEATGNLGKALMQFRQRLEKEIVAGGDVEKSFQKYADLFYRIHTQVSTLYPNDKPFVTYEALPAYFETNPEFWARANSHHSAPRYLKGGAVPRVLAWLEGQSNLAAPEVATFIGRVLSDSHLTIHADQRARVERLLHRCVREKATEIIKYFITNTSHESEVSEQGRLLSVAARCLLDINETSDAVTGAARVKNIAGTKEIKAIAKLLAKGGPEIANAEQRHWLLSLVGDTWFDSGLHAAQKGKTTLVLTVNEVLALAQRLDRASVSKHLSAFGPGKGFSDLSLVERCNVWQRMTEVDALRAEKRDEILVKLVGELESLKGDSATVETACAYLLAGSGLMAHSVVSRVERLWVNSVAARVGIDPEGSPEGEPVSVSRHHAAVKEVLLDIKEKISRTAFASVAAAFASEIKMQGELCDWLRSAVTGLSAEEIKGIDRGWKVTEAITVLTRNDLTAREDLLNFLLAPGPGDYSFDSFAESMAEEIESLSTLSRSTFVRAQDAAQEIKVFHGNFWGYRPEYRALIVRQLFRVTEQQMASRGGRQAIQLDGNTFAYVAKRLFPGADSVSEQARVTVRAYADALDPIEQPFVLSGLLFATRQVSLSTQSTSARRMQPAAKAGEDEGLKRIGEAIAQFVSARDPGLQKLGQVLAGLPGVPEEIRAPNRKLLDKAAPMQRWDQVRLARHVEARFSALHKSEYGTPVGFSRFGRALGDGTMATTIEVRLTDGRTQALTLRKPFALERGQAGLAVVGKASQSSGLKARFPQIATTMSELVSDAGNRLVPEADYSLTRVQYETLGRMYAERTIVHGENKLTAAVAKCRVCDFDFAVTDIVPGTTLASLQRENKVPHFVQAARATHVFSSILHLRFDTDRSAGNVMVDSARTIELDPKAILLETKSDGGMAALTWSGADAQLFGRLLGKALLGAGQAGAQGDFLQHYIRALDVLRVEEAKQGRTLPLLVREANKAILTASGLLEQPKASPYSAGLVLYSVLRNGMHPDVARGVSEELLSERNHDLLAKRMGVQPGRVKMFATLIGAQVPGVLQSGNIPPMILPALKQIIPALAGELPEPIRVV